MISVDIHINDTTRHADLILPGTVALEEAVYDMVFHSFAVRNTAAYARPLFEPPEGVLQEWELIARLTARVTGANQIGPSPEQVFSAMLPAGYHPDVTVKSMLDAGTALDLGPLVPSLSGRLETQDAARLRISDDDNVQVSSNVGAVKLQAEITSAVAPGVVSIPPGWGNVVKRFRWPPAQEPYQSTI